MDVDFNKIRTILKTSLKETIIADEAKLNSEELRLIKEQELTVELITHALELYHRQLNSD